MSERDICNVILNHGARTREPRLRLHLAGVVFESTTEIEGNKAERTSLAYWMRDRVRARMAAPVSDPSVHETLLRAERKLAAYIGVCAGDTELTNSILPMMRAAIAATSPRRFQVGSEVRAAVDCDSDLREDGMGVERCASKGEALVVRKVTQNGYEVSYPTVLGGNFHVAEHEIEPPEPDWEGGRKAAQRTQAPLQAALQHLTAAEARVDHLQGVGIVAELAKDTARIEFLEHKGMETGFGWVARASGHGRGYRLHQSPGHTEGNTARTAIDLAMAEEAETATGHTR